MCSARVIDVRRVLLPEVERRICKGQIDALAVKQREEFDKKERQKIVKEFMDYDLDQVTRLWLITPYKINVRRPNFFNLVDTEAAWNPLGWGSVGVDMAYRRTT